MDKAPFAFSRTRIHALISVLLVFIFVQALDAVIHRGIFRALIPTPPGYLFIVLLVGVSQTVAGAMLRHRRVSGALPRARELLLTLLGALILLWILSGRPFRGDFIPWRPDVAWPVVLCALQWLLTLSAQNALHSRELFLSLVIGKTGHELVKAAREAGGEAGEAEQAMRRLKRLVIVFDVFVLLPYLVLVTVRGAEGNGPVSTAVTVRVILQAAGSVAFIIVVNGLLEQQLACASGVAPEDTRAAESFGIPLAGVAALFILALVIPGGKPLLPIAWIGALLNWLSSRGVGGGGGKMPPATALDPGPRIGPLSIPQLPTATPSPIMESLWRILAILAVAAAALGLMLFIVRPLLTRSTRRAARDLHPLRFLRERAALALRALTRLPKWITELLRASGKGLRGIPRAVLEGMRESVGENRAAAARSQIRLRASARAVREFHRIARWGGRAGMRFTAREGPMEYARRLALRAPQKASALHAAAALVEELIYGESPSGMSERALARLVDGIVR